MAKKNTDMAKKDADMAKKNAPRQHTPNPGTPKESGPKGSGPKESEIPETMTVTVKPGSRKGPLVETAPDGTVTVYVREPATEGRANKAVGEVIARHLGVPKSCVSLIGGATARVKRFRID